MKVIKLNKNQFESYVKDLTKKVLLEQNKPEPYKKGDELSVTNRFLSKNKVEKKKGQTFKYRKWTLKLVEPITGYIDDSKNNGWWAKIVS